MSLFVELNPGANGQYEKDRAFSDRYLSLVPALIGRYLLRPSTLQEDRSQATDLRVLVARDLRIACRFRRSIKRLYWKSYPFDFTIRDGRGRTGAETEYAKMRQGWGDWFFYGHAREDAGVLCPWWLVNLHAWRHYVENFAEALDPQQSIPNLDDDRTTFRAYDIRCFYQKQVETHGPAILVASSHPPTDDAVFL